MMRYHTISRFKLVLELLNKFYFTNTDNEYANTESDNQFLKALTSWGYQVEEMTRLHYPNGVLIEDEPDLTKYNYQEKVNQTNALLK